MSAEEVFQIATGALRTDAGTWRAQIANANTIQQKLSGLHFGTFESVSFGVVMAAYEHMWTFAHERMKEAVVEFEAAGRALENIANKYERVEAERSRALQRLRDGR